MLRLGVQCSRFNSISIEIITALSIRMTSAQPSVRFPNGSPQALRAGHSASADLVIPDVLIDAPLSS